MSGLSATEKSPFCTKFGLFLHCRRSDNNSEFGPVLDLPWLSADRKRRITNEHHQDDGKGMLLRD